MCKITILESCSVDFIFGLDNMRSHRCQIDLTVNQLKFPDAGITVNFLSDGEINKQKVEELKDEEIIPEDI